MRDPVLRISRSLGIQWGINKSSGLVKPVGPTDVGTADSGRPLNVNLGALDPTSAFGLLVGTFAGTDVDVVINAAEERGDLYIVSDPSIVTLNGQTTVIGGLSRLNDNLSKRSVPFFSKIPLLGNLFKNKNRLRENSELMVFITPHIVKSEGTLSVQTRVREVEERQESMRLEPILKTDQQIAEEKARNAERMRVKQETTKGNKYVR
jgi:type II secretory pathway component GspD/PulD (secretin)